MTDSLLATLKRAQAEIAKRAATCHERVACPKCKQPIGARCVNVRRLAEPRHRERVEADGTPFR